MSKLEEMVKSKDGKRVLGTLAGLAIYGVGHAFNLWIVDDATRLVGAGYTCWNGIPLAYNYVKSMVTDYNTYRKIPKK